MKKRKLFIKTPRKLHAVKLKTARRVKLIQLLMRETIRFRLALCKLVSTDILSLSVERSLASWTSCGDQKEWRRSFNGEIIESRACISHLHLAYYHPKYANHSKRPKWWIRTRFYVSTDVSPGHTMFASVNLRAKLRRWPNALANNRKFHHAVSQTIPENLDLIAWKFERYQIESKSAQVHASCWKLVMTWDSVWPEL